MRRSTAIGVLGLLLLSAGAVLAYAPEVCTDGCDDEEQGSACDATCADCPCCAQARPPVVVADADGRLAEHASILQALEILQTSRPESRDVFHVPRPLV